MARGRDYAPNKQQIEHYAKRTHGRRDAKNFAPFIFKPSQEWHKIRSHKLMDAALILRLARPLPRRSIQRLVRFLFDGASNERQPVSLLPLWRLAPTLKPIIGGATRATDGGNDLGGGILGKLVGEGHGQTVSRKNKSAMPKIVLDKRRQCRQITCMSNATQAAYISDASALIDTAHLCCTTQEQAKNLYRHAMQILRAIPTAGLPFIEVRSIRNLTGEAESHLNVILDSEAAQLKPIPTAWKR